MYELKKIGNVFTSKSVGTGPSSYEKSIYRAAVSQSLRNTGVENGNREEPNKTTGKFQLGHPATRFKPLIPVYK